MAFLISAIYSGISCQHQQSSLYCSPVSIIHQACNQPWLSNGQRTGNLMIFEPTATTKIPVVEIFDIQFATHYKKNIIFQECPANSQGFSTGIALQATEDRRR